MNEQKIALVTGANKGIGFEICRQLAGLGCTVLLGARDTVRGSTAAEQLQTEGLDVVPVRVDMRDPASFSPLHDWIAATHGRLDILINNVGGTIWTKPFEHYGIDEIEKEIRRSLFPTLWGCRAALPWMLKQGKGSIVNISSVATAGVNRVPYSAAKGGVNALTRSIAMEYSGSGIRINAVAPGGTEAPPRLTPRNEEQPSEQEKAWYQQVVDQTVASSLMHRYGTLAEQANAILFLASDEASYITGVTLPVAGGDLG